MFTVGRGAHVFDAQHIFLSKGQAAVGFAEIEQLTVLQFAVGGKLYQYAVAVAIDHADQTKGDPEVVRAHAQGFAQLLTAVQARQGRDLIECMQGALLALHQVLGAAASRAQQDHQQGFGTAPGHQPLDYQPAFVPLVQGIQFADVAPGQEHGHRWCIRSWRRRQRQLAEQVVVCAIFQQAPAVACSGERQQARVQPGLRLRP